MVKTVDGILRDHLVERSTDTMKLFHCQTHRVFLSPGQQLTLDLKFLPLKMQPRQCCVVLSSKRLGDLVLLVCATVKEPKPSIPQSSGLHSGTLVNRDARTLHMKSTVGETFYEELLIESSNIAFEAAVLQLSQWQMTPKELRRRTLTNSMRYASLHTAIEALQLEHRPKTYWDNLSPCSQNLHFTVKCNSAFFTLPDDVLVPSTKNARAALPLEFSCDHEGHYSCQVVLTSDHDIRVYNLEVMVLAKERSAVLELHTLAAHPLTQDIPLVRAGNTNIKN